MFMQCQDLRKRRKDSCNSSHNTLLHRAERDYTSKSPSTINKNNYNTGASQSRPSSVQSLSKTTTLLSVSNVKDLLHVAELQLTSFSGKNTTALVLCDTAYSNSWVTNDLSNRLGLHGTELKLTVKSKNTEKEYNQEFEPLKVSLYVKKDLNVGAVVINI